MIYVAPHFHKQHLKLHKMLMLYFFGAVGGPKWDNVEPTLRPEKAVLGLRKRTRIIC